MITIKCPGCDVAAVEVAVAIGLTDEKIAEAIERAGFVGCSHCVTFYHRIGCFTFHKPTTPVPFTSRQAERMERKRLAWLEAA